MLAAHYAQSKLKSNESYSVSYHQRFKMKYHDPEGSTFHVSEGLLNQLGLATQN